MEKKTKKKPSNSFCQNILLKLQKLSKLSGKLLESIKTLQGAFRTLERRQTFKNFHSVSRKTISRHTI